MNTERIFCDRCKGSKFFLEKNLKTKKVKLICCECFQKDENRRSRGEL
jgi:hypothetical protein